jgi:hypothetical protein
MSIIIIIIIIIILLLLLLLLTYMQENGEHASQSVEIRHKSTHIIESKSDRTIQNNKPDIAIRDNEKELCLLIEAEISGSSMS